jgi:hypothetical protein
MWTIIFGESVERPALTGSAPDFWLRKKNFHYTTVENEGIAPAKA